MATINKDVIASTDDAVDQRSFNSGECTGYSLDTDDSTFDVGCYGDSDSGALVYAGVRFQDITVLPGSVIESATLSLTVLSYSGGYNLKVWGVDADSPSAWGIDNWPYLASRTTASVVDSFASGTIGVDVTTIVQEIVARGGWASGNDIAFVIGPTTDWAVTEDEVQFYSFDNGSSYPTLEITYNPGLAGTISIGVALTGTVTGHGISNIVSLSGTIYTNIDLSGILSEEATQVSLETWGDPQANVLSSYVVLGILESIGVPAGYGLGHYQVDPSATTFTWASLGGTPTAGKYKVAQALLSKGIPVGDALGVYIGLGSNLTEGLPEGDGLYGYWASLPLSTWASPWGNALLKAVALGELNTKADLPITVTVNYVGEGELETIGTSVAGTLGVFIVPGVLETKGLPVGEGSTAAAIVYLTLALHGSEMHPSVFSNYKFNSFCSKDGANYGANDTGIFLLGGDTDAGTTIHPKVLIPGDDFDTFQKRLRSVHCYPDADSAEVTFVSGDEERHSTASGRGKAMGWRNLKGGVVDLHIEDFTEIKNVDLYFVRQR